MLAPYCTNVHPAPTLDAALAILESEAVAVRAALGCDASLPIGWWLPHDAVEDALARLDEVRDRLAAAALRVVTVNAFPYGDFHQDIVKRAVYAPDWTSPDRARYTMRMCELLAELLPEGGRASVSTVPIGWPDASDDARLRAAAIQLQHVAASLAQLEADTGKHLHLDLEPEPGCILDRADDVVRFFESSLLPGAREDVIRRHIGVCHDVCHAAVMFEAQDEVIASYAAADITIGKVQVSSALRARFDGTTDDALRLRALRSFAEDRYLHQTSVRLDDGTTHFFDDLPIALHEAPQRGEWRVHFHVPIHATDVGDLETTQPEIDACIAALPAAPQSVEIETYAWSVLPAAHRPRRLADGIADEIAWFDARTRDIWSSPD